MEKPNQGSCHCPKCKDANKLYFLEGYNFRCANCGQIVNSMGQALVERPKDRNGGRTSGSMGRGG